MATLASLRADTVDYIRYRLGDGMVDVELDPEHYDNSIDKAVKRFRQRSQNAYESSYVFVSVIKEQQEYTLPDEIEEVRQVFRRSVGSGSSDTGTQFEPFEAAFQNTYLLQSGRIGGMATYEMYYQYQELSARLFGGFINFEYNPVTKKLTLLRKFSASGEQVVLWTYNLRPESRLLQDRHAGPWIKIMHLLLQSIHWAKQEASLQLLLGHKAAQA